MTEEGDARLLRAEGHSQSEFAGRLQGKHSGESTFGCFVHQAVSRKQAGLSKSIGMVKSARASSLVWRPFWRSRAVSSLDVILSGRQAAKDRARSVGHAA